MRLERLAGDIFDTICGPSIIHPAAHYRKIVQNIVQCLTSNAYNPQGESCATGSSDVEGIFTSLLDGGFDWTVCGCPDLFTSNVSTDLTAPQQSEMPPRSRITPTAAADSRASPYPVGQAANQHRFCISLLNLHSGRTPGHNSLFVPSPRIVFTSCFLLLSFISPIPLLQLSSLRHPQVRSHALFARPILHSLFRSSPSPLLLLSSLLLFPLTVSYTLTMFSLVLHPPLKPIVSLSFVVSRTVLRLLFFLVTAAYMRTYDILLNSFLPSAHL